MAQQAVTRGAGEILLTAINHNGTRTGFDLEFTSQFSESLQVPVIAYGGAGSLMHFEEVFNKGKAGTAMAAGIFHYREVSISGVHSLLSSEGSIKINA